MENTRNHIASHGVALWVAGSVARSAAVLPQKSQAGVYVDILGDCHSKYHICGLFCIFVEILQEKDSFSRHNRCHYQKRTISE